MARECGKRKPAPRGDAGGQSVASWPVGTGEFSLTASCDGCVTEGALRRLLVESHLARNQGGQRRWVRGRARVKDGGALAPQKRASGAFLVLNARARLRALGVRLLGGMCRVRDFTNHCACGGGRWCVQARTLRLAFSYSPQGNLDG